MDRDWQAILRIILGAASPFIPGGAVVLPAADKVWAAIQAFKAKSGLTDEQMEAASEDIGSKLDLKAIKWEAEHPAEEVPQSPVPEPGIPEE